MKKNEIKIVAEIAIFVGVAFVLDFLGGLFSPFRQGGSISIAMLPIFILSFRHGWKKGVFAGLIFGTLQALLFGNEVFAYIYDPTALKIVAVIVLDYLLAFALLGFAGIFKDPLNNPKSFILGIAFGSFLRYLSHSISGVTIWASFASDFGIDNIWFYSFIFYNLPYMAASFAVCLIVGLALYKKHIWDYGITTTR